MRDRYFSAYRTKDYRTPRSMREAYGMDCELYVGEPETDLSWFWWIVAVLWVLLWTAAGWL